jgi:hypothetical protein
MAVERDRRVVDLGVVTPPAPRIVTAREFIARPRAPIEPFVGTPDGRTTLLARENTLLVAGPSGVGKSLAASFDLPGRLAKDIDTDWLGLRVRAQRRVLLLPFEGADEEVAERFAALVDDDARDRFWIWDRWIGADLPQAARDADLRALADLVRKLEVDVVVIDTATAFFGSDFAVSKGEAAHAVIEDLRARSGRRFAAIVVAHTRKADRGGAQADPLEEVSGTFARKADAVIVIRRPGDDPANPRRTITFAKVRRGPQIGAKIATLPEGQEVPRLELVADAGRQVTEGTEAEAIAAWIGKQDEPVRPIFIETQFAISERTLKRRLPELEALGIRRDTLLEHGGRGRPVAYGTDSQWRRALGLPEEVIAS